MKEREIFTWYLPPKPWSGPRAKPYRSGWKMTAEEAAKLGATQRDETTREVVLVPETPEEEQKLRRQLDTAGNQRWKP